MVWVARFHRYKTSTRREKSILTLKTIVALIVALTENLSITEGSREWQVERRLDQLELAALGFKGKSFSIGVPNVLFITITQVTRQGMVNVAGNQGVSAHILEGMPEGMKNNGRWHLELCTDKAIKPATEDLAILGQI